VKRWKDLLCRAKKEQVLTGANLRFHQRDTRAARRPAFGSNGAFFRLIQAANPSP